MEFKLILAFVDDAKTDEVLDAARAAGSTGATIVPHAQGQGMKKQIGIFGLEILAPRTILLLLVEERRASAVLDAVREVAGLDESVNTGVALELDVSRAVGLSEHVKQLSIQHPAPD